MQPRRRIVLPSVVGGLAGGIAGALLAPLALVLNLLIDKQLPTRNNDELTALIFGLFGGLLVGGVGGAILGAAGGLIAGFADRRDVGILGGAALGAFLVSVLLLMFEGTWNGVYTAAMGLCGAAGGACGGLVIGRRRSVAGVETPTTANLRESR